MEEGSAVLRAGHKNYLVNKWFARAIRSFLTLAANLGSLSVFS
jgi:hypothetical protein